MFVHFLDTAYGLAGCANGKIYKTLDSGQSWTALPGNSPGNLNAMYVLDSLHAWGAGGSIYKYNGSTWSQVPGTAAILYSIFFLDSLQGWASGMDEKILHTTDGGNTWTTQHNSGNGWVLGTVYFSDTLNGWASGDHGKIYRHDVSGWNQETTNFNLALSSIYFPDVAHGWATSWQGKILRRDLWTGNVDVARANDALLFPNPASHNVIVNIPSDTKILISDLLGKVWIEKQFLFPVNHQVDLDVSSLPPGIYFIHAGITACKFVKE
jgi:hypothetical protein